MTVKTVGVPDGRVLPNAGVVLAPADPAEAAVAPTAARPARDAAIAVRRLGEVIGVWPFNLRVDVSTTAG